MRYPSRGPDGGRDGLVAFNENVYLLSCKHLVISGRAVGVSDEPSILDRLVQHGANGFIGFYSTLISTSLDERLHQINKSGTVCLHFDANSISNHLPNVPSYILQKYGNPKGISYPLHVDEVAYRPLCCLGCGVDILKPNVIRMGMALVCFDENENIEYLYGCKICLSNCNDLGWVDLHQALHPEQLSGWIGYVDDLLKTNKLSNTFYKHKSEFEGGIQQRMFPSNWGRWLS